MSLLHNPVLALIGLISLVIWSLLALLTFGITRKMRPRTLKGMMQNWNDGAMKAPWPMARTMMGMYRFCELLPNFMTPPPQRVMDLIISFMRSQVVIIVAELAVPDALKAGPRVAEDIALAVGAKDVDGLTRVLDTAVSMGLLDSTAIPSSHGDVNMYRLNAISAVMCTDHPNSVRPIALLFRDQIPSWQAATRAIKEGGNAVAYELMHPDEPGSFWDHLKIHPERMEVFNAAMVAMNNSVNVAGVLKDYPWTKFDRLVDIGGGKGGFLTAAMKVYGHLEGVVFDMPEVVEAAEKSWRQEHPEFLHKVHFVGGSFFDKGTLPPATGPKDVYVLRNILHDWNDEDVLRILSSVRAAIGSSGAMLAIVEMVMVDSSRATRTPRRLSDLHMMVMHGGQERSEGHFQQLLFQSGFELKAVKPTRSLFFVVEAEAI